MSFRFPIVLALAGLILLNSCASILNPKYQRITVNADDHEKFLVNNETAEFAPTGKLKLERDHRGKQITLQKSGCRDQNFVIFPYKRSKLIIMSWVPFGFFYLIPPLLDFGPKSYSYPSEISLNGKWVKELDNSVIGGRELMLNNVALEINTNDLKYRYFSSFRRFVRDNETTEPKIANNAEAIKVERTVFSDALNDLLVEKGFIDTNQRVLNSSYTNNLYLDATIKGSTFHSVGNTMFYCDLTIEWQLLDYYMQPIYKTRTSSTSGQYLVFIPKSEKNGRYYAIKDAMELAFLEVMRKDEVQALLQRETLLENPDELGPIFINKPTNVVASLGDAIESSVTIKNKDGHGSGFIISNDGYIVTNYHVVAGVEDMTVVFSNGIELGDVEVVRVSKSHDLALLKVNLKSIRAFNLNDSKTIEIGKDIFAVGTPTSQDLAQTITRGIISAKRKLDNQNDLLQIDASINGGNSGGAIIDKNGLVIGVVSSKIRGEGIEGIAFGIPAYEIFEQLKVVYQ